MRVGRSSTREGTPAAIDVESLTVTYSDGTTAIDEVSLSVPAGECFGFLGPNGAGKTTTISVLATRFEPTAGTARVNGFDVTSEPGRVRESIGYMAQETAVIETMTARENLEFACRAYGVKRERRAQRIAELLDLAGLADVTDKTAGDFSGGMQKRLDAATALVHRPPIVFLDEPTTGLDPQARNSLWEYIEDINDQGTTVFLTTQYLEEADRLCDRLAVIEDGSIVTEDTPEALKRTVGGEVIELGLDGDGPSDERVASLLADSEMVPGTPSVDGTDGTIRVRTPEARERAPDVLVALRDAGLAVTHFDVHAPTLEDVFLSIVADDDSTTADRDGAGRRAEVGR